ncbi:synaptophysin-like isoform X3 [Branchiostoma lanceolatum]|uniref:SYP protein n=1 Tax=Branchiostoma lanceolatum TaxID=7740 RepID=A0A8K0ESF2_BRALA|nr:SYP [Branchiostoma lanceolatum]
MDPAEASSMINQGAGTPGSPVGLAQPQMMTNSNMRVVKEPRGFLKLLQFIFAIFAFATASGGGSHFQFSVTCNSSSDPKMVDVYYSYPYRLEDVPVTSKFCENATQSVYPLVGNENSSAEYFVTIGVFAFLYSLVALTIYVFVEGQFGDKDLWSKADLFITTAFAIFWFTSSSAWAAAVADIKWSTYAPNVYTHGSVSKLCSKPGAVCTDAGLNSSYANLNVSILFGFLNFILWAGNIWFTYKETPWHAQRNEPAEKKYPSPALGTPTGMEGGTLSSPSQI